MQNHFDFETGQQEKIRGIARAANRTPLALRAARLAAKSLARTHGWVTADDVYELLDEVDRELLGNAAGAIFRGKEWVFVDWVPSRRTSNHGRMIRRWGLKG